MPAPPPLPYVRSYDFSDHEASSPAAPAAGAQHDAQLDDIAVKLAAVIAALEDVRRSDGVLKNYLVTLDALSPTLRVMMGGWVPKGAWVTATAYAANDLVRDGSNDDYVCVTAHTSGVFATDVAANKWMKVAVLASGGYASAADVAAAQAAAIASSAASLAAHTALANPHATTAANVGALPIGGGTLTGALTLAADPVSALQAATKQYADAVVAAYAPLAGATFSGNILAPKVSFTDANFYAQVSGTAAYLVAAANNFIAYDRTSEWWVHYTNAVTRLIIDKTGRIIVGGGSTPATGYTAAGDITLPATGGVYAKNSLKAWVNFNGTGVVAIRDSFNVSSITDNGTGDYTINFTNALANTNYSWVGSGRDTDPTGDVMVSAATAGTKTTTALQIAVVNAVPAKFDSAGINVFVVGG